MPLAAFKRDRDVMEDDLGKADAGAVGSLDRSIIVASVSLTIFTLEGPASELYAQGGGLIRRYAETPIASIDARGDGIEAVDIKEAISLVGVSGSA